VCTYGHVRCAHAHDMLRSNSRVADASACRAVRLHSHKSFAHLESRDKLSDVIESSSSITCSCAVSIRGTPGAAPRQSRGNVWWRCQGVGGGSDQREAAHLPHGRARTNESSCLRRWLRPAARSGSPAQGSNCVQTRQDRTWEGGRKPGSAVSERTARSLTRGPCHVWMGAPVRAVHDTQWAAERGGGRRSMRRHAPALQSHRKMFLSMLAEMKCRPIERSESRG
jgi:hypothetical protein